ncbi:UDP-glycosyltransferase UGT5-like [Euwallacea similis]|uniref:UDP-glycosyltransferase UGT5-like n=1 Tax=Euwallacea similis TaxID=1736056 RepID=UPI00344B8630
MWSLSVLLVCGSLMLGQTSGLKLLFVFPVPAKSHYFLGNELGKGLARLGHEVTMISAYEEKNPPKNYFNITLSKITDYTDSLREQKFFNPFSYSDTSPFFQLYLISSPMMDFWKDITFSDEKVQQLLKSNQHFDAVIVEQFWNDAMKVFAHHFNAHLIVFSTIGPNKWVNNLVANPENPSYVPDLLLNFNEEMTFFQRLYNAVFGSVHNLLLYQFFYPKQNALMKKYFPDAPELEQLLYNVSLVLTNGHDSINDAIPHVPNMIDIGGFHVNPPKELPNDLKHLLDNASEGVIYFSLGSNIQPSLMSNKIKKALLKTLGGRKEKILWKWDEKILENQPSNFLISKWFPQQSILAHKNCKLFISHGGLLSTTETIYFGVPVLALPVMGDQKMNAARIVAKGMGVSIPFAEITEKRLTEALELVLEDPKYKETVEIRSNLLKDRPMKPIELADYWIKYVVRHKGAPHLRVAGIQLPLYKYYMLDVIAVILVVVFVSNYVLFKLIKWAVCKRRNVRKIKKE